MERSKGRKQEGSHVLEAGSEQVLGEVKINKYFCKVIKTAHLGLQNHEAVVGIRKASLMVGGRKVPSQNGVEGGRAAQDERFEEALFEQPPVLATIAHLPAPALQVSDCS